MKTHLIDLKSPKYIRRLTRELNARLRNAGPVYAQGHRQNYHIARAKADLDTLSVIATDLDGLVHTCEPDSFIDAAGRQIRASRAL